MSIVDYATLYEPYTKDGATLAGTIRWLRKQAVQFGVAPYLVDVVIQEAFKKLASGTEFSKNGCEPGQCFCGGEPKGAHTAIEHWMRNRMIVLDSEQNKSRSLYNELSHNMDAIQELLDNMKAASDAIKTTETKGLWQRIKDGLVRNRKSGSVSDTDTNG